jgi:cholesterol transport system auxiliary component
MVQAMTGVALAVTPAHPARRNERRRDSIRPPRRGWSGCAIAVVVLILIHGCGGSGPPLREHFYALQPDIQVRPSQPQAQGTLLVLPLAARGFAGGSQIVFRTAEEPLQVQRYDDLLWEQTPGRALSEAIIASLRAARTFQYVISIADRARGDYILSGELTRLEHRPTAPQPNVAASFNLTLVVGDDRATRFSRTYAGEEPTLESTPEAMVRAFNGLTGRLLSEALRDLERLAPRLPRPKQSGG